MDKVKPYTGPEPISWLKPESTGPVVSENEAIPMTDHTNPPVNLPEKGPSEIHSPQIRTPGIGPRRTKRPPKYLVGYEWRNQAVTENVIRNA